LAGVAIVDDHLAPAVDTAAAAAAESSSTGSAQPAQASAEAAAAAAAEAEAEAEGDPVINQVEFYHSVLMPLQDRHAAAGGTADAAAAAADAAQDQDQQGGLSTSYLVAVLLEYIRSLHEHNIRVHRCFYTAVISALTQCSPPRYYQLHQLLQYHVLDDSVEVAMKVLALKTDYPPAAQQGIDMLHRLALHNDVVDVLLDDKQVRHTDTASAHTQTPVWTWDTMHTRTARASWHGWSVGWLVGWYGACMPLRLFCVLSNLIVLLLLLLLLLWSAAAAAAAAGGGGALCAAAAGGAGAPCD
jgi:hypothetical protein